MITISTQLRGLTTRRKVTVASRYPPGDPLGGDPEAVFYGVKASDD